MRIPPLLALICWSLGAPILQEGSLLTQGSIIQLELPPLAESVYGTAVLVDRQQGETGITLYYLTAEQLFASARSRVEVERSGPLVHFGVLRIFVDTSDAVPQPMRFDPPAVGDPFIIVGVDAIDHIVVTPQRVGAVSANVMIGDRGLPGLIGCIGAPAMVDGEVFGIVTACDADRAPTIELLVSGRAFLADRIPILQSSSHRPTLQE